MIISHSKVVLRVLFSGLVFAGTLWLMAIAPAPLAADATAPLLAFQKNRLPSQKQLKESYSNFTYRPLKRKDLTFNLLIPNGWKDIPLKIPAKMLKQDTQRMIPLAEQMAPGDKKTSATIQVAYTRMDMEMSLHDLMDQYLRQNKVEVLLRRQGTFNRRKIDEVVTRFGKDKKSFLSRLTFSRHGDRVFVVSGSAGESEFGRYAPSFAAAAISFTVHQKASHPYAAPMASFTSAGNPRLKFNYPRNWEIEELQKPPAGQTAVDMRLVIHGEKKGEVTTYGFIHAAAFSKSTGKTPDQILAYLKEGFQSNFVSYQLCTLKADMIPKQTHPLGRLEKWDVMLKGVPGEAAFLVLPRGSDYVGLQLFCMRPKDNLVSWWHVWRVFEILANDLTRKHLAVAKIKSLSLPSAEELKGLAAGTMRDFAAAVKKQDFKAFRNKASTMLQIQATPGRLRQAFSRFARQKELAELNQMHPIVEKEICLDHEGLLKLAGHYPTQPQATTFRLAYTHEQDAWKLLGIHVAMKNKP